MKRILAITPLKKGDAYGAALTGKAADALPSNRSRSGLNTKFSNTQLIAGSGPQPAPGNISPALRHWRRKALLNNAAGLTCKGTIRKRRPNAGSTHQKITMRRQRGLKAWNERVMRLRALGLTTRGTARIYAVRRGDALLLKSQVDDLASSIAAVFHALPAPIQVKALELESSLSVIRKQIA